MATIDALNGVSSKAIETVSEKDRNQLDKEAFLKLFLQELSQQDPTAPMESEKILEQTALLANMETQQMLKEFVEDLSETMTQSAAMQLQYAAVGMVGKKVDTDMDSLEIKDLDKAVDFQLYFDKTIKSGEVRIEDMEGNLLKAFNLSEKAGKEGYVDFSWNLTDSTGTTVAPGTYKIVSEYFDENQEKHETKLGRGKVESVLFDKGSAYLKLGDAYFPTTNVAEYYE